MKSFLKTLSLAAGLFLSAHGLMAAEAPVPEPAAAEVAAPLPPPPPVAPDVPEPPAEATTSSSRHPRERVKVGADLVLGAGEVASDVVVVSGDATIDGEVRGDLVVVNGNVTLNAKVRGEMVVVLGSVTFGPGAEVGRDLVVVGEVTGDGDLPVGGHRYLYDYVNGFPVVRAGIAWAQDGLLLGRPLTPGVPWVWLVAGVLLLMHVVLQLLLPKPVQAGVDALEHRPLGSLFAGVLFLFLLVPVVTLLAMSVIGIVLIPFLLCALVVAALVGKVAIYRFVGEQLGRQTGASFLRRPLIALLAGTALLYVVYLIPVIGLLTWAAISVVGVGAVLMAMVVGLRQEAAKHRGTTPPSSADGGGAPFVEPAAALAPVVPTAGRVGFWLRTAATFLDLVLIGVLVRFTHLPQLFLIVWAAYHIGMWAWKGTTIGGIILGLRIVRTDGRPVDFAVAFVRAVSSVFSALVLGLGFFWAGWSRERQSWHDRIAGTCVVKVARGHALI